MSRTPRLRTFAIAGLILAIPLVAFAGPWAERQLDPQDKIDFITARVAKVVDADDEQRALIADKADALVVSMTPIHEEGDALRQQFQAALAAEELDPVLLEDLRQDGIALADRATSVLLDHFVDVASELSQEQRQALSEHHGHHARHRFGHH